MTFWLFGVLLAVVGCLGVLWESFGGPLGDFLASLDVLLAAVECLGGPLGIPGGSWDVPGRFGRDLPDFPGNFGRSVGSILHSFLVFFILFCWALVFDRFLKRCCIDVGIILVALLETCFGTFPTSRKRLHPTTML